MRLHYTVLLPLWICSQVQISHFFCLTSFEKRCAKVLGHLKIINFPFVPNGKFIIFRFTKTWAHYSLTIMCLNIGTPKNHHFSSGTNGKVVVLGVPILKHFRVCPERVKVNGYTLRGNHCI